MEGCDQNDLGCVRLARRGAGRTLNEAWLLYRTELHRGRSCERLKSRFISRSVACEKFSSMAVCLLDRAERINHHKAIFSLLLIRNSAFYCWRSRNEKSELQHSGLKMLSSRVVPCFLLLTFSETIRNTASLLIREDSRRTKFRHIHNCFCSKSQRRVGSAAFSSEGLDWMEAILTGSSQSGWQTTTSTAKDPSSCSLHSTSKEPHNSSLPSLRIRCPTRTDTESLATSKCPASPA